MTPAFDLMFDELPGEIPVFPLPRVILLPRVQLPLNVFEPRYLAMTRHALKNDRLIGMVQVQPHDEAGETPFGTGCAGRITSFSETDDGRYLITLTGVCRFTIKTELEPDPRGFRKIAPDWSAFAADLIEDRTADICREAMMATLRAYFDKRGMFCDKWETMKDISCEKLVSTLSVVCPFDVGDKQALLEARTLDDRMRLLQCFLDNELKKDGAPAPCRH